MKKIFLLFLSFVVISAAVWLVDIPFLPAPGKIVLLVAAALTFEIFLMDTSFLKRKMRAELRKNIDENLYP
jgi:hypothetical protein